MGDLNYFDEMDSDEWEEYISTAEVDYDAYSLYPEDDYLPPIGHKISLSETQVPSRCTDCVYLIRGVGQSSYICSKGLFNSRECPYAKYVEKPTLRHSMGGEGAELGVFDLRGHFVAANQPYVRLCKVGDRLAFHREPSNIHDINAIEVFDLSGHKLGYVPKEQSARIAGHLDSGAKLTGSVVRIYFDNRGQAKLDFSLYISKTRPLPSVQRELEAIKSLPSQTNVQPAPLAPIQNPQVQKYQHVETHISDKSPAAFHNDSFHMAISSQQPARIAMYVIIGAVALVAAGVIVVLIICWFASLSGIAQVIISFFLFVLLIIVLAIVIVFKVGQGILKFLRGE